MTIARTIMIDDDGSGTTGTIINSAWKQEFYGQIDQYVLGGWAPIAFAEATFAASGGAGGVWTVGAANIDTLAYAGTVNAYTVLFTLVGAITLSDTASRLTIGLPLLTPATRYTTNTFSYYVGTQAGVGMVEVQAAANVLNLYPALGGALWQPVSSMYLMGQITFPFR